MNLKNKFALALMETNGLMDIAVMLKILLHHLKKIGKYNEAEKLLEFLIEVREKYPNDIFKLSEKGDFCYNEEKKVIIKISDKGDLIIESDNDSI